MLVFIEDFNSCDKDFDKVTPFNRIFPRFQGRKWFGTGSIPQKKNSCKCKSSFFDFPLHYSAHVLFTVQPQSSRSQSFAQHLPPDQTVTAGSIHAIRLWMTYPTHKYEIRHR